MSWDERYDRFEKRPVRTGVRWALILLGLLLVTGIVVTIVGFANNWGQKAVKVVSPANVEKQYGVIIDNWEALTASADNACLAQSGETSEDGPLLIESPEMAYAATYRSVRADYNAAWANVFDAGLVGPPGYPKSIPNWTSGADPDFCTISTNLVLLQDESIQE